MKRVLCAWFPHWPLQRVSLVQPELKGRPVVLYAPARSGAATRRGDWQVAYCARAAVEAGVRPGMPLAEAQSLLERSRNAHFAQHDPQADRGEYRVEAFVEGGVAVVQHELDVGAA